jgi:type IV secretion system protein VirB6
MSGFAIFGPAYVFIDGKLDQFLAQDVGRVIAEVEGPLRCSLVLYVLLYGFAIMRGAISEPVMDFAVRSIKLAIIYRLATTVAYNDYVTQPLFHSLPDAVARAISGGTSGDPGVAFDRFLARAAYLAQKIGNTASPVDFGPWIMAGAVQLVGGAAAALGFGIVVLAKVALALIICLGPIFVACALFEATRRYFFGWLGQAVNYILLLAMIIVIFQLVLSLVDAQWGSIDSLDPMAAGLLFIALSLLGAIFFLQTPNIAAGVAGGASAGLADFGNAAGMAFRGGGVSPQKSQQTQPSGGGSIAPTGAR